MSTPRRNPEPGDLCFLSKSTHSHFLLLEGPVGGVHIDSGTGLLYLKTLYNSNRDLDAVNKQVDVYVVWVNGHRAYVFETDVVWP